MGKSADITGQTFGKLTAIEPIHRRRKSGRPIIKWKCKCECGGLTETTVDNLRSGGHFSCGCGKGKSKDGTPLKDRFDRLTIPEPNSGCLLWLGTVSKKGYGTMGESNSKARKQATHIALRLAGRPLPDGMIACHHCDNPFCVEATHLFAGTYLDNYIDAKRKGRIPLRGRGKHASQCRDTNPLHRSK